MTQTSFDHDAHLILVSQGDHNAFIALYQHEAPHMLTLGKKMLGRNTEAQDAVKDTFILIWKHAESCDTSMTSARAWMYSIFRHRAFSTLREPGRMAPTRTGWTDHLPAPLDGTRAQSPTYTAIQHMDPAQRRPLLMAYYHGTTYRQIAAQLGSTIEHVQRHIQQGLRHIRTLNQP